MTTIKKTISILALLILTFAAVAYYVWNKPHQNMFSAQAESTLSADELLHAFETNELAANQEYLDKVITVKGEVKELIKNNNSTIIVLTTNSAVSSVNCELDPLSTHAKMDFQKGEKISINGICSGFLSDVVLNRCVVNNR